MAHALVLHSEHEPMFNTRLREPGPVSRVVRQALCSMVADRKPRGRGAPDGNAGTSEKLLHRRMRQSTRGQGILQAALASKQESRRSGKGPRLLWTTAQSSGLHFGMGSRASGSISEQANHGTSTRDGGDSGKIPASWRERSPQEWKERRQSPRELRALGNIPTRRTEARGLGRLGQGNPGEIR
jgi:hypothetical protein